MTIGKTFNFNKTCCSYYSGVYFLITFSDTATIIQLTSFTGSSFWIISSSLDCKALRTSVVAFMRCTKSQYIQLNH